MALRRVLAALALCLVASSAMADECKALWLERNGIFDARGYCFGTALGAAVFDNSDCRTNSPVLTSAETSRVARIKQREDALGCKARQGSWTAASLRRAPVAAANSGSMSCRDLWVARNILFDSRGYCFKTPLGKGVFDNSDCYTSSPQLTPHERDRVALIQRREEQMNCAAERGSWTVASFGGRVTVPVRPAPTGQNLAPWQKFLQGYVRLATELNASGGSRTYRCEIRCSDLPYDQPARFSVYANSIGDAVAKSSDGAYQACRPFGGTAFLSGAYCE